MTDDRQLEIRTFTRQEEIWALPEYKASNPITKENYEKLVGDYDFSEEITCCFQKQNGHLCNEGHKRGWVAKLKDHTITVVGNVCARDKFDADARIRADRTRYLNEKRKREKHARLTEILAERNARLKNIEEMKGKLAGLKGRMDGISNDLGTQSRKRLYDMARTGNAAVTITAVNHRDYIDSDGEKKTETRRTKSKFGEILGVKLFVSAEYQSIFSAIKTVEQAFLQAQHLNTDAKTSEVESLVARLEQSDNIVTDIAHFLDLEKQFLRNNFVLLCYLTHDKAERYKAARLAVSMSGGILGKDRAKIWLHEKDNEIRASLSADQIEF